MDLVDELHGLEGDLCCEEPPQTCQSFGCDFLAGEGSEFCCVKCEHGVGHGKRCAARFRPQRGHGRLTLVVTLPYAPIVLSKNYMHEDEHFRSLGDTYDMTPRAERHALWKMFAAEMRQRVERCNSPSLLILDATPIFEERGKTDAEFREAFMKEKTGREEGAWNGWTDGWLEDNHPDFIKTQGHLAKYVTDLNIPGVAPVPALTVLYPTERRHLAKPFW